MRIEQQPSYVLHSRPYRETSLLLECLTRDHGRIGGVARGVRGEKSRLQRAQLEPFQPLALDLMARGELATLVGVEGVGAPQRLSGEAGLAHRIEGRKNAENEGNARSPSEQRRK